MRVNIFGCIGGGGVCGEGGSCERRRLSELKSLVCSALYAKAFIPEAHKVGDRIAFVLRSPVQTSAQARGPLIAARVLDDACAEGLSKRITYTLWMYCTLVMITALSRAESYLASAMSGGRAVSERYICEIDEVAACCQSCYV